jgi:8-oxo-dGTP diphosphatase
MSRSRNAGASTARNHAPAAQAAPGPEAFPHPAVTVDVIAMTVVEGDLKVLLIERDLEPYRGMWAIPGGFVRIDESLEEAARRELKEETGLAVRWIEQLYTFGDVGRDPRMRVVTVTYLALVDAERTPIEPQPGSDARRASWASMYALPLLAFDHRRILDYALRRLRSKLEYSPIAFQLLPPRFTLSELRALYEVILGKPLDRRNFRRKMLGLEILRETGEQQSLGSHRPAQLFEFELDRFFDLGGGVVFSF